jgi:hypothetical protein
MPLVRVERPGDDTLLGLWQMTEQVGELPVPPQVDLSGYRSEVRRREVLVTYALINALTGDDSLTIGHEPSGRPMLEGWHISISHTRGWAAVVMSRSHEVAVDIEYRSDRVSRVVERFIRPDEDSDGLHRQLINWSAKETVYKYFSAEDLQYFEMRLLPYALADRGTVQVEDLKVRKRVRVCYEVNADFVLTYVVG